MTVFQKRKPAVIESRDLHLVLRLSATEMSVLDKYASAAGATRSEYVRGAIGARIAAAPAV